MEEYTETTLSNGTVVRTVDVPTMLTMDAMRHYPELEYPEEPGMVDVPTRVGVEHREPRKGDKLYDEWKTKYDEVDERRSQFINDFPWEVGVVGWQEKDAKKFTNDPPKGWRLPERYVKYGESFSPYLNVHRLAYIRYVVVAAIQDFNKIWQKINKGMLISEAEVDDTVAMFPGDTQPPTVA